jgi:tungstate transport system ATP-binding protein
MLEVLELRHELGGRTVLSVPSLRIERGERLAIVGPNGAGKSTLLRVLAFLDRPAHGRVLLDGAAPASRGDRHAARRRVTMVEQRPFLFRGRVLDNAAWGLVTRGVARADAERRAGECLELLGVAPLADRPARSLSEGEAQRVAVARALATGADVLLLDEPVSGADRAAQGALYTAITRINAERGVTVCVASHRLEEAYRWTDRVLALHGGSPVPVTPENLFRVQLPGGGPMQPVTIGRGVTLDVMTDRSGMLTLAIPPEEIVLSRRPLQSSARNQLPGRIVSVAEQAGAMRVTVEGGVELIALVTRRSFEELGLAVGAEVVASFKSVAIRVF